MLIDIHTHTTRYSACGRSTAEEMVQQAERLGLDAMVITDHNTLWSAGELAELQHVTPRVRLLRAIEVTSTEGDDYLVYGILDPAFLAQCTAADFLLKNARRLGGVVVLAHPYRYREVAPVAVEHWGVDGVEVASNNIHNFTHSRAVALAERLEAFMTVATDAHHTDTLGLYALRFRRPIRDEADLAAALRERCFAPLADTARLKTRNAALDTLIPQVLALMEAGLDDKAIHAQLSGVTFTMLTNLRVGNDIHWPATLEQVASVVTTPTGGSA
jgi:3',5'-nucleoside bisphosphate phosphatase